MVLKVPLACLSRNETENELEIEISFLISIVAQLYCAGGHLCTIQRFDRRSAAETGKGQGCYTQANLQI
jgi:hypothetical protein